MKKCGKCGEGLFFIQCPPLERYCFYIPMGDDPAPEWIAVYNRGSGTVNLAAYKLGDRETQGDSEGMYHFLKDTKIDPGQVIVIANRATHFIQAYGFSPNFEFINSDPAIPDMAKYRDWAGGSFNLSNSGDEVLVLSPDDDVIDSISWGNSTFAFDPSLSILEEGHSWERRPADQDNNHVIDWYDQPDPQPGAVDLVSPTPTATITPTQTRTKTKTPKPTLTLTPTPSQTMIPCNVVTLLITEILYDPDYADDPDGEWIEVFNNGYEEVNLGCVKIGDEETFGGGEGMLIFPFGSQISPGEIILISRQSTSFSNTYKFKPDYEIVDSDTAVPDMGKYSAWASGSVNLSNSGDDSPIN